MSAEVRPALPPLAVVIPAFRRRYLAETLESFAAQTDQRFRIYVADDGSPEPLAELAARFAARLDLVYHRFPDNLGIAGMTDHWHRAIALSQEPWVWLFSDDDFALPDCVAAIHAQLAEAPDEGGLLRFDVEFIDEHGTVMRRETPFPARLSAVEYARHLLEHAADPCMIQNVVFPRAALAAAGGFSRAVGGYCSDYATWPRFARGGGVRRLASGGVRFRLHGASVGAFIGLHAPRRDEAIAAYADVVRSLRDVAGPEVAASSAWRSAEMHWFGRWFGYLARPLTPEERERVDETMRQLWPRHPWSRQLVFRWSYARTIVRLWRRRERRAG